MLHRRSIRTHAAVTCTVLLLLVFPIAVVKARVASGSKKHMSAVSMLQADPQPVWHHNFVANFNETTKLAFWSWQTSGKYVYAADQNAQRVDRENGRGDR